METAEYSLGYFEVPDFDLQSSQVENAYFETDELEVVEPSEYVVASADVHFAYAPELCCSFDHAPQGRAACPAEAEPWHFVLVVPVTPALRLTWVARHIQNCVRFWHIRMRAAVTHDIQMFVHCNCHVGTLTDCNKHLALPFP